MTEVSNRNRATSECVVRNGQSHEKRSVLPGSHTFPVLTNDEPQDGEIKSSGSPDVEVIPTGTPSITSNSVAVNPDAVNVIGLLYPSYTLCHGDPQSYRKLKPVCMVNGTPSTTTDKDPKPLAQGW